MNILVLGPQHSCTRLVVSLFDKHPDVNYVGHCGTNDPKIIFNDNNINYDKIIIVSREENCINKSNEKHNKNKKTQGTKAIQRINKQLNKLSNKKKYEDIVFFSFDTFYSFRKFYLQKILESIDLNTDNYDFNFTGLHTPKEYNSNKERWFTVNLEVQNCNEKYIIK